MSDTPFPPLSVMAPWLAGHGAALLLMSVVCGVALWRVQGEARARRLAALGWGVAATTVPVAWLVARWMPEWTGRQDLAAVLWGGATALIAQGLAVWVAVYLADVGAMSKPPRRSPTEVPTIPPAQKPTSAVPSSTRPSTGGKPTISAPAGATVPSGSGRAPEADGLLRVLAEGSDMQRAAAARALALSFGRTASKPVVDGLLGVLADEDADDESRVEAWVATCRVMGDPLPWAEEATLRNEGPAGIDPAQVLAWQDRLNDPD